jgi:hypothetical protein
VNVNEVRDFGDKTKKLIWIDFFWFNPTNQS